MIVFSECFDANGPAVFGFCSDENQPAMVPLPDVGGFVGVIHTRFSEKMDGGFQPVQLCLVDWFYQLDGFIKSDPVALCPLPPFGLVFLSSSLQSVDGV